MYFSYIGVVLSVVEIRCTQRKHGTAWHWWTFSTVVVPKYTRAWAGIELKTVAMIGIFSYNHTLACIGWALNINRLQVKYNCFCWPIAREHFLNPFHDLPVYIWWQKRQPIVSSTGTILFIWLNEWVLFNFTFVHENRFIFKWCPLCSRQRPLLDSNSDKSFTQLSTGRQIIPTPS